MFPPKKCLFMIAGAILLILMSCGEDNEPQNPGTNDGCEADSCSMHGTCDDTSGNIECTCEQGYTGEDCSMCDTGFRADDLGGCVLIPTLSHTGDCAELSSCSVNLSTLTMAPLRVQLLDRDESSMEEVSVQFDVVPMDAADVTLDQRITPLDESGFAEVDVRAGTLTGMAEVNVTIVDDAEIEPIQFIVDVTMN